MESRIIDLSRVIGVYVLANTGTVLVHAIDFDGERVLASINGGNAEWCGLTEAHADSADDMELGFFLGSIFVPLSEVMRFYGGEI